MRWDVSESDRAVTGHDVQYWWRLRAKMAPVTVQRTAEYETNAQAWRARNITALPLRRPTAKYRKSRGLTPCPVYVAHFPGGRQLRVSFWSPEKGPIDFAQGCNVAATLGRGVIVDGYVDVGGNAVRDPEFAPKAVAEKIRAKSSALRLKEICRALNEGEIDAALMMARAA